MAVCFKHAIHINKKRKHAMSRFKRNIAPRFLMGLALFLGLAVHAHAAPITGTPVGNDFGWVPNSTNALNYAQLVPGREGQVVPYVLFNSNTSNSVVLDFFNFASAGIAFFEYRIDGVPTGTADHQNPNILDLDTSHFGQFVANQASVLGVEFIADEYVDIRLALGGERDWDFDWVRFDVAAATVPVPATFGLFAIGLLGLVALRRRRV